MTTITVPAPKLRAIPSLVASLAVSIVFSSPVAAQEPTLAEVLENSGIEIHGYLDVAYSWISEGGVFTSGTANRVFDTEPNSFNLHQAAIIADIQPEEEGWGGLVNLTAGRDARVIKSFDTSTNDFDVTQAYVRYTNGRITLIGGKYVTLAGAELIDPTGNPTYSRSILFGYAIPFAHTGARASFSLSDALSLVVGVNNGWDQLKDANEDKTVELGLAFAPGDMYSLYAQAYSGKEPTATSNGRRDLIDVVLNIYPIDRLGLTFNYDFGKQDGATSLVDGSTIEAEWSGWAAYLKYQLSDQWRLLLRAESMDDKDGFRTGAIQEWEEVTLGFTYAPVDSVELRFEVRADRSNNPTFLADDGSAAGDDQQSAAVEILYKF